MTWPIVKLGDVCEIVMGQAPSGDTYNEGKKGYPLIAGAGDFKNGCFNVGKYTTEPTKLSKAQDIVISIRASIGDKVWVDGGYCLGRGVAAIRASSKINKKYLWHTLSHVEKKLLAKGRGATFLQVNKDDIQSLTISLPPLAEQRRIAAVLDKAEEIKRKREAAITKLDQLAQSVFVEMFGDPISNDKSWKQSAVGELPIFIADGNYSSKYPTASEFVESGVPFIRANNLKKLTVMSKDLRFISKEKHSELAKGHLQYRDVLIITRGEIGKVGLVPKIFEDANINAQLVLMRCINDEISPDYLCHLFNNKKFLKYVENFQTGAALKQLPVGNLKKIKIPIPTKEMQARFAKFISHLELNIARMDRCESTTINLTSSLQHQAFTTGFET